VVGVAPFTPGGLAANSLRTTTPKRSPLPTAGAPASRWSYGKASTSSSAGNRRRSRPI